MPQLKSHEIAEQDAEEASLKSGDVASSFADTPAVGLSTMFGHGDCIVIGHTRYEVAPIPLKRLAEGGALIQQCPDMLVTHALVAALNGGVYEVASTAEFLRKTAAEGAETMTDDLIGTSIAMGAYQLGSEPIQAMTDLIVLVLQRRHKDLTTAMIEDDIDIPVFLDLMRALFTVDPHLRERFDQPGQMAGG